jgi:hypothetical protein
MDYYFSLRTGSALRQHEHRRLNLLVRLLLLIMLSLLIFYLLFLFSSFHLFSCLTLNKFIHVTPACRRHDWRC